jgi:hypothetical protein
VFRLVDNASRESHVMTPEEVLSNGRSALDPLLATQGFEFVLGPHGDSSGGAYVSAAYVSGERRLELHVRHSLGLVTYRVGGASVGHEALMRYLGVYGRNAYPGFSNGPMAAFERLRLDLQNYCHIFLAGSDAEARDIIERANHQEALRPKGLAGLP